MKTRIILFAAAMFAVCACNKDNAPAEGKQMTISVNAGGTKVADSDNGDQINFTWEEGDEIWVNSSHPFILSSGAGTSTAAFTGTLLPSQAKIWSISYNNDPDLSSQTYNGNKLPADKMSFFAMDLDGLDNPATLEPTTAVLQLNFKGSKTISKITVEQKDRKNSGVTSFYTLNFNTNVQLTDTAQAFYVVIWPAWSHFEVIVYDKNNSKLITKTTTEELNILAGKCFDMPTLELN